ncbi:NAD(P)/FAD-dependent oxidoreductase [Paenibacillus aurantius]|uniref:NAD(P)/FAD-dependent oxidoreductase n=1 Tax=Paenibacillus aurantius TaxID=2918900 RepID=A0AA96RDW7_9BACL|nr:NAD(P)/FAD-dependent oxidoreductase [Paenibacillus aurantius]WNQ11800.1 NAD(P)/FAD-dependent oxidoreductase [Paenibacillus aurantius]
MSYDCAIVGGGPAGLNAALVLGRARRTVALLDANQPRNGVTHASHGFLTRDGVKPAEFRRVAYEEVLRYPTVRHIQTEVMDIRRTGAGFLLLTSTGERVQARKLIVAAGLKDAFPPIEGFHNFYGKSLFVCPFCDGWELRDQKLAAISDQPGVFHMAKMLLNWTRDVVVCTNGRDILTAEQKAQLASRNIPVVHAPVVAFSGQNGRLERIYFGNGTQIERSGGFIAPLQRPNARFEEALGYQTTPNGGMVIDEMGRTTAAGVYAAGDSAYVMPSQLIHAAASGSKAAMAVVADLTEEDWR